MIRLFLDWTALCKFLHQGIFYMEEGSSPYRFTNARVISAVIVTQPASAFLLSRSGNFVPRFLAFLFGSLVFDRLWMHVNDHHGVQLVRAIVKLSITPWSSSCIDSTNSARWDSVSHGGFRVWQWIQEVCKKHCGVNRRTTNFRAQQYRPLWPV